MEINTNWIGQKLQGLDFSDQNLNGFDFSEAEIVSCNFDRTDISFSNFKKAKLINCRFRGAKISMCDFRYAEFSAGTLEDTCIDSCDFYRAFFDGVILFSNAKLCNCSFNKTYFGDSAFIKKENLVNGKIIQQDKEAWRKFLVDCHNQRTNDQGKASEWDPSQALKHRWGEAEEIYKNFNALWTGRGFIADGNWAYVQGRRMELRRMCVDLCGKKLSLPGKIRTIWKIIVNILSDLLFGYGESMTKMVLTYILTVFFFAWAFHSNISLLEYGQAVAVSLKNMAGMDSEVLSNVSPLVDMLNVVQTTIGIILTGIFGFILGNKIRNQ